MSSVPFSGETHSRPSSSSHMRRARLMSVVTKVPLMSSVGLICDATVASAAILIVVPPSLSLSILMRALKVQHERLVRQRPRHADLYLVLALLVCQHLIAVFGLAGQEADPAGAAD